MRVYIRNYGDNVKDIENAIKKAGQRIKELEIENQKLKNQLKKFKTVNAKQRQRIKSQAGALRTAKTRIKKLRTTLSTVRRVTRSIPKIKGITHRSRAQYLEQVKPQFINRFIQRLHETYADFKQEWDATVRQALMGLAYDEIDGIMRMLNLDSMYYESNGYRPNTGATGQMIYEYFVQFNTPIGA